MGSIFANILEMVSEETEIDGDDITGDAKRSDIVDARAILVCILYEYGFYTQQISEFINRTGASVRYLSTTLDDRKRANRMIDINLKSIRKKVFERLG